MTKQRRAARRNALDDLLPGPDREQAAAPAPQRAPQARGRRQPGRNALDDLLPGPDLEPEPAAPARRGRGRAAAGRSPRKVWVSFEVPADVRDAVRDAAAALSGDPVWMTMGDLAERALRAEVERLAAEHNRGRPFPRSADSDSR